MYVRLAFWTVSMAYTSVSCPAHRWILTWRHDHRSIARSRNRVWPRACSSIDVRASRLSASLLIALPLHSKKHTAGASRAAQGQYPDRL